MILCTAGIEAVSRGLKQSTENPAAAQNSRLERLREFFWGSREDLQKRLRVMTADAMYCFSNCNLSEAEIRWNRLVTDQLKSSSNDTYREIDRKRDIRIFLDKGCRKCGVSLNVTSNDLYPPDTYFEAGNRGTLSFMEVDMSKFRKQKEKRWRSCFPFFDSLDSWGIHRKRTQLRCVSCNMLLGFIYYDMPRRSGHSLRSFGSSQTVPKGERYRLKMKALQEAPVFHQKWQ